MEHDRYANYKFKSTESTAQKYNETLLPILVAIEKVLSEDPRCIDPVRIERDLFEPPWWEEG